MNVLLIINLKLHKNGPRLIKNILEEETVDIVVQINGKKKVLLKQKKMLMKKQLWI